MRPPSVRFRWTKQKRDAAEMLAAGHTTNEVALSIRVETRSVRRWKADLVFSEEVDRLTLSAGIATAAERLRIVKRIVRQRTMHDDDGNEIGYASKRDLLDWLKLAHDETSKAAPLAGLVVVGFDGALQLVYGSTDSTSDVPTES
jgi:hypothetical protein